MANQREVGATNLNFALGAALSSTRGQLALKQQQNFDGFVDLVQLRGLRE